LEFIQTVLAFVVTLGVLVTIHEWGHFIVARLCGVKVLRFSVGFGKVLYSKVDKQGTEFALAAIPLGGYVKMLDEREGDVPDAQRQQAFNTKSVWQRIAIVAAGPVINLLFAVLAYWVLFVSGVNTVAPVIGSVVKGSIAEQVSLPIGAEIVAIDGRQIGSWQDVNLALARRIGESGNMDIEVQGGAGKGNYSLSQYQLQLDDWSVDLEKQGPIDALGIVRYRPEANLVVAHLVEGGRAKLAGLRLEDEILAISGHNIKTWQELVETVQAAPEMPLGFTVQRATERLEISVTPGQKTTQSGDVVGYIGVGPGSAAWPEDMIRNRQLGLIDGLLAASDKTWQMTSLTLSSIKKMIEGIISVKNLSGPITIAKVASATAQSGFEAYISFLAYLSISLGVLNLLPIPMLDGGHLLYYFIEVIKGKPVSERIQGLGLRIGMALLFSMMAIAMFNDVMRL